VNFFTLSHSEGMVAPYSYRLMTKLYFLFPSLWDSVKKFTGNHPEHVSEGNAMEFISNDGGEMYASDRSHSKLPISKFDHW
jgi:hypothetical protein